MFPANRRNEVTQVLRLSWIGMVMGESGIRVAVQPDEIDAEVLEHLGSDETGGAIPAVQHHSQPPGTKRNLLLQHLPISRDNVPLLHDPPPRDGLSRLGQATDRLNLASVDGPKTMGEFEAVKLGRVVAGGNHYTSIDAVVNPGEIKNRRNDRSDVDDVAATCRQPPHYRVADPGRTLPVVTADNDREPTPLTPRTTRSAWARGRHTLSPQGGRGRRGTPQIYCVTSCNRLGHVRRDITADNATDVVF